MQKVLYNLLVIFMLSFVSLQASSRSDESVNKQPTTMSQKLCCCLFNARKPRKIHRANRSLGFTPYVQQGPNSDLYVQKFDVFIQGHDENEVQDLHTRLLPKGSNLDDYETL